MARVIAFPERRESEEKPEPARLPSSRWLLWWVAACLVLMAWNTGKQFEIQQRLLTRSRELERIVGESRTVSAETNQQLVKVKELDAATERIDGKLARVSIVNAAIKEELLALESIVEAIRRSVVNMDAQAGESHALLAEIARQSGTLHAILVDSQRVGERVEGDLVRLAQAQEAINVDLAEMNRKTDFLDRRGGGD